jgi:hypothetical protein
MSLEVVSTIFWCHCSHITATAAVLLLLLLSYYCCFHITPVTSAFPGAAELTTQLLRLISILYLPLCRINKFGLYYPRRLSRSPILVGYQDCFLAPLPGRHSSTHKFTWGVHSTSLSVFIFFYFVSLSLLLSSLFVLSLFLSSIILLSLLLSSFFLSCFTFLIYPKIHKNLKNLKIKNCCYGRTNNLLGAYRIL